MQYTDFYEDGFAKFELTPEQASEGIGEALLIETNSTTGLPISNPSKRTVVYAIPSNLPRENGLEGYLIFEVTGIYARPTHGGSSQYRRFPFEETYKIRWRIIEDEYLIYLPKKSDREFAGDMGVHEGIDFAVMPSGNFYLINNQIVSGPYTRILPPNMKDGRPIDLSDDPSEIPKAAKEGYLGWGFYDDARKGWMIMRKHKEGLIDDRNSLIGVRYL